MYHIAYSIPNDVNYFQLPLYLKRCPNHIYKSGNSKKQVDNLHVYVHFNFNKESLLSQFKME